MTDRSAVETTVVVAVAELLAAFGSDVAADTLAVFVNVPTVVAATFTTMSIVADAPRGKIPTSHAIVVVPEHEPVFGVADTSVTPGGRVSTTLTPLVVDGPEAVPLFVTVRWYERF